MELDPGGAGCNQVFVYAKWRQSSIEIMGVIVIPDKEVLRIDVVASAFSRRELTPATLPPNNPIRGVRPPAYIQTETRTLTAHQSPPCHLSFMSPKTVTGTGAEHDETL